MCSTSVTFLISMLLISTASAAEAKVPQEAYLVNDVSSWPRMKADEFGCLLETVFKHRDLRFNCALKAYKNSGDLCKNTGAYYEGPKFPQEKAQLVHPLLESIELAWEHGELQSASFTFREKMSEREALDALKVSKSKLPSNVSGISVQECSKTAVCVSLRGFDHMGGGDVECP